MTEKPTEQKTVDRKTTEQKTELRRIKVRVKPKNVNEEPVKAQAQPRPTVKVEAKARKLTFTRTDLPDGDFMMNYYFRRDEKGRLIPEDINSATHFERVVFDRYGNTIGSMNGRMSDVIKW